MTTTPTTTQDYYDRFAAGYEAERHHGYHRLIDELELDLVRRFGTGKDVFEAGCGTGLLLRETARLARAAVGLDLSRGMLRPARGARAPGRARVADRGAAAFRVVRSRLQHEGAGARAAHRARHRRAGAPGSPGRTSAARVLQPAVVALSRQAGGRARASIATDGTTEKRRLHPLRRLFRARSYLPPELELVGVRGVRVLTPTSKVFAFPPLGRLFGWAEHAACDCRCCATWAGS